MNTYTEQPVNYKALGWTIGIHALLLLLFFAIKYSTPEVPPTPPELGMEVNLGTSADGSGTDQPMNVEDPAAAYAATPAGATSPAQQNDITTGNDPDAPAVNTTTASRNATGNNTRTTTQQTANASTTPKAQPQPQAKYVYAGGTGKGGNSATENRERTSEGNTTGDGDRGVPGGTPGAANYEGSSGNGTGGISHTLGNRSISPRQFEAEFNTGGTVVIRITVDKDGNIIDKRIKSSPNAKLSQLALQKLSQARFSKSNDAAPQQFGEVTIVFKTRS